MSSDPTQWVKASRSASQGQCVEMRQHDGAVEVRDTKAGEDGPRLRIAAAGFADWLKAAKNGAFDHLVAM